MSARLVTVLVMAFALAVTPGCDDECDSPTGPCPGSIDLTGSWSGTSSYINAPFTMDLRQSATTVTGQYRDRKDTGSVSGTLLGTSVTLDVNFGDTGLRMTGIVASSNRLAGEILVPVLGSQRFPFEMMR